MTVKRSRAEALLADLSDDINAMRDHVVRGGCSDWGQYCTAVGAYKAMSEWRTRLTEYFAAEDEDDE